MCCSYRDIIIIVVIIITSPSLLSEQKTGYGIIVALRYHFRPRTCIHPRNISRPLVLPSQSIPRWIVTSLSSGSTQRTSASRQFNPKLVVSRESSRVRKKKKPAERKTGKEKSKQFYCNYHYNKIIPSNINFPSNQYIIFTKLLHVPCSMSI